VSSVMSLPWRARAPLTSKRPRPGYPRRRGFSFASIAPSLLALVLLPACYNPTFADGKLLCADGGACPSGFSCRASDSHCWRDEGPDAGSPRDADASRPDADQCPVVAIPNCKPQTTTSATCDPVCQTGCGCNQKCSAMLSGQIGCLPITGARKPMESCQPTAPGTAGQNDGCQPGSVCLTPGGAGEIRSFCFALCRDNLDCAGLPCNTRQIPNSSASVEVCDLPSSTCDPTQGEGVAVGCADGDRPFCYLIADTMSSVSRTVCEYVPGAGGSNAVCSSSRDCYPRFACPPPPLRGAGLCHPVCDATHPCLLPSVCRPWGAHSYCAP